MLPLIWKEVLVQGPEAGHLPTPVFSPGESRGQRSLVGSSSQGCTRVEHSWSNLACTHPRVRGPGFPSQGPAFCITNLPPSSILKLESGALQPAAQRCLLLRCRRVLGAGSVVLFRVVCVHARVLQSCPTLCDPMDHGSPGSSVWGILQARSLEWVAMPSSKGSSWPRDQTNVFNVSCIGSPWEAHYLVLLLLLSHFSCVRLCATP